jgi:hypothetical protein
MTKMDNDDRLKEALQLCSIHSARMSFAYEKVKVHFPLTVEIYNQLEMEEVSFFDQLIFRFSKLQDCMGGKLFPTLLEKLGEETRSVPFIDLLSKLEALKLIENAKDWLLLRETRNIVTHEYPFNQEDVIEGLNLLSKHYSLILIMWKHIDDYILERIASNSSWMNK